MNIKLFKNSTDTTSPLSVHSVEFRDDRAFLLISVPAGLIAMLRDFFDMISGFFRTLDIKVKSARATARERDPDVIANRRVEYERNCLTVKRQYDAHLASGLTKRQAINAIKNSLGESYKYDHVQIMVSEARRIAERPFS